MTINPTEESQVVQKKSEYKRDFIQEAAPYLGAALLIAGSTAAGLARLNSLRTKPEGGTQNNRKNTVLSNLFKGTLKPGVPPSGYEPVKSSAPSSSKTKGLQTLQMHSMAEASGSIRNHSGIQTQLMGNAQAHHKLSGENKMQYESNVTKLKALNAGPKAVVAESPNNARNIKNLNKLQNRTGRANGTGYDPQMNAPTSRQGRVGLKDPRVNALPKPPRGVKKMTFSDQRATRSQPKTRTKGTQVDFASSGQQRVGFGQAIKNKFNKLRGK